MASPKLRRVLTDICIVVTVTLTMAAGLEVTARLVSAARRSPAREQHTMAEETIGLRQSWGRQHAADAAGALDQYMPYVEFREREYASPTLNIDREGRRRVPGSCERDSAVTVLTFGGSTMFGAGVPDEYTIPAYLAADFNRQGHCVRIINYGSSWWQSSQSLVQLIEVIKHGMRPQVVIFYDGINEVNAVGFGGVPGGIAPDAAAALRQAFEPDRMQAWARVAQSSVLVRTLGRMLFPVRHKAPDNDFSLPESEVPGSAAAVADVYATNVRTVNALAREYGFAAHFFLQPVPMIGGKRNTVLEEAVFSARARARGWERALFHRAYRAFGRHPYLRSLSNFHDISGIFDGMTGELYQDSEHLLPEGNRIVAERIARELTLP